MPSRRTRRAPPGWKARGYSCWHERDELRARHRAAALSFAPACEADDLPEEASDKHETIHSMTVRFPEAREDIPWHGLEMDDVLGRLQTTPRGARIALTAPTSCKL